MNEETDYQALYKYFEKFLQLSKNSKEAIYSTLSITKFIFYSQYLFSPLAIKCCFLTFVKGIHPGKPHFCH
ncbi:hypothetical protein CLW00_11080 [Mongoliibacter ruber]|uniref:Uncharacterized protein n=1 Tax=Mongoliibacter ruber TaxID=1750599 RepID=A0A2T0WGX4_9BACT|nr:hypothetical protein CLW00_11080 [Mongoliibacter ruber]